MNRADRDERFYVRGFTTFLIVVTFSIALVSGLVLYGTPRGRVANWTGWAFAGIDKEQWGGIHINSTLTFAAAALLHVFYNWKVLLNYIRNRRSTGIRHRRELAAALGVAFVTVVGTLYKVPPYGSVLTAHEWVKDYWESGTSSPAIVHGEDLTLSEFAREAGVDLEQARTALAAAGVLVPSTDAHVGDLAASAARTPGEIYAIIQPDHQPRNSLGAAGWGRTSVAMYCQQSGTDLSLALERLREHGLSAEAHTTFRDLATRLKSTPREVAALIAGPATQVPGNHRDG